MLADELLALGPDAPLAPERAAELVRAEGLGAEGRLARRFSVLGGRARGSVFGEDVGAGETCACAVGAFDGVHLGHRELLARARREADARGARAVAVTFLPDPADVLGEPQPASRLLPVEDRVALILGSGIRTVVVFDFDEAFAALTYGEFAAHALREVLDPACLVVGSDFRLGAKGAGTVGALAGLGREAGFDVVGVDLVQSGGAPVSATRVRGLVREGRVERAAGLLCRPHRAVGRVVHGRGEGSAFGFPTANIELGAVDCLPAQGVYAAFCVPLAGGDRQAFPAAVNVGAPPTFSGAAAGSAFLEANLLGFSGDLYGSEVACLFMRWLRDSRPFGSLEELRQTVLGNIDWVARTFGDQGISL
ncbi:MAG: riboflavin biosynthesis protein RibF [Coriobacteriia bacterium]|nr:riboflavin biosynthesis protein RibF [Coriobacteriia bacterium]